MITTNIDYPEVFPWPSVDGYKIQHTNMIERSNLDSGRARQRVRFSKVPSTVNASFFFDTDEQAAAFEAWFRDVLKNGAGWFNCRLKTSIGLGYYVCRFKEVYEGANPIGICAWEISAELEIWERPLLPVGSGLFPEYLVEAAILDRAMNELWAIN